VNRGKARKGIPEVVKRSLCVSAIEDVTFTRLEGHHDGLQFANGVSGDILLGSRSRSTG